MVCHTCQGANVTARQAVQHHCGGQLGCSRWPGGAGCCASLGRSGSGGRCSDEGRKRLERPSTGTTNVSNDRPSACSHWLQMHPRVALKYFCLPGRALHAPAPAAQPGWPGHARYLSRTVSTLSSAGTCKRVSVAERAEATGQYVRDPPAEGVHPVAVRLLHF